MLVTCLFSRKKRWVLNQLSDAPMLVGKIAVINWMQFGHFLFCYTDNTTALCHFLCYWCTYFFSFLLLFLCARILLKMKMFWQAWSRADLPSLVFWYALVMWSLFYLILNLSWSCFQHLWNTIDQNVSPCRSRITSFTGKKEHPLLKTRAFITGWLGGSR